MPLNHVLKAINDAGRVGGYLVVWGSPQARDLQGEYFTSDSELGIDWYDRRPVLYHHGLDGTMKASVIGVIDSLKADETGVWAEAQLNMREHYVRTVLKLVEKGILGWSSGSLPHLVDVANDGHIKRWPIVEGSLTPTPAEPRRTEVATIKSAFTQLGLDTGRLTLDTVDAPDNTGMLDDFLKELCAKAGLSLEEAETATGEGQPAAAETPTQSNNNEVKSTMDEQLKQMLIMFIQQLVAAGAQISEEQASAAVANLEQSMQQPPADGGAPVAEQAKTLLTAGKFADLGALLKPLIEKELKPVLDGVQKRNADMTAAVKSMALSMIGSGGTSAVGGHRSPESPAAKFSPLPTVKYSKYDNLSAADMSFMAEIMPGRKKPWAPSPEFMREISGKSLELVKKGEFTAEPMADAEASLAKADRTIKSMTAWAGLKANELDYSSQAGFGDEWVPDLWSSNLWKLVRLDNVIAPLFQVVEMPSDPFELPLEGADPTVYFVPETKNETDLTISGSGNPTPDSQVGSGKVQLASKKLSLRVGFSTELVEDSIIPVLSQYKAQAQRAILNAIDNVTLNGDTATSGNVNYDGGTPNATDKFMALIGLRRILVDTVANAVDMGNVAPTLAKIREARFTLDPAKAGDISNLALITGSTVYAKLLSLSEVITVDKYGPGATVLTGEIGKLDGIPVLWSAEQAANASNGKVSSTGANNTRGSLELIHRLSYVMGYRRRINVSIDYLPYYDSYQMTANVRLAFARQDADSAAVLYNIATS